MADVPKIDWSAHEKYVEDTVTCVCGVSFRSHSKFVFASGTPGLYSRRPCPSCTGHNLTASRSDPEVQTL